jgi:hypothetical protein
LLSKILSIIICTLNGCICQLFFSKKADENKRESGIKQFLFCFSRETGDAMFLEHLKAFLLTCVGYYNFLKTLQGKTYAW